MIPQAPELAPRFESLPDPRPLHITVVVGADQHWRYDVEGMQLNEKQLHAWLESQVATGRYIATSEVVLHWPDAGALGLGGHATSNVGMVLDDEQP